MPADIAITCSCGSVKGIARGVSSRSVNRVVCGCADCQAYAHYLGRADEVLDARGGTEVMHLSPGCLALTEGIDHIACLRLTPSGALRWYTACCKSPIANTMATREMPFLALLRVGVGRSLDKPTLDELLGPVRARVNGASTSCAKRHQNLMSMLIRYAGMLVTWRLRGDHKRSPFFDVRTGNPIVEPRVLSADEYREIMIRQDGHRD